MRRLLVAVLGALYLMLSGIVPVSAATDPDTITIVNAYGYGGVLETGDILLLVHYDVDYDSCCPSETARQSVLGWYLDGTTRRRSASPFVFVNSGYGQGVLSIYFDAADATTFSITHADADSAEIAGNPSVFPSPWSVNSLITWRTLGSQAQLESDVANIASLLEEESEWSSTDLIQSGASGALLTDGVGEDYFENAIPNLRIMAGNLFASSLESAVFVERTFTESYATTLETSWTGTRLENSFSGLSTWLNVPEQPLKTTVSVLISLVVGGFAATWLLSRGIGASAASGAGTAIAGLLMVVFAHQGLVSLQIIGVIGLMLALLLAGIVALKRAS